LGFVEGSVLPAPQLVATVGAGAEQGDQERVGRFEATGAAKSADGDISGPPDPLHRARPGVDER
jgi:hypothetical protein